MRIDLISRPAALTGAAVLAMFALAGCPGDDEPAALTVPGPTTGTAGRGAVDTDTDKDAGRDDDAGDISDSDAGSASDSDAGADDEVVVSCGSRGLSPCPTGEFCDHPPSAQCGEADAPGVCRTPPAACTLEFAPVCGCDGKTYANACAAATASVSVRSSGECSGADAGVDAGADAATGASDCGGLLGLRCADDEYCDYAPGALCGRADATGTCKAKPRRCTREYRPVCGCDGKTYATACVAQSDGISVETEGECK